MNDHDQIRRAIAQTEAEMARLDQARQQAAFALEKLRFQLAANYETVNTPFTKYAPPQEKIQLFADLFRGRDDVFARLWESKKTGKKGYSPVCEYEWQPGICTKPEIKCTNCKYTPLTHDVLRAHLEGQHVIGVYPLRKDETCYFLNENRNHLIINDVIQVLTEKRFPLILTERREHLELLHDMLQKVASHLIVLHGGKSAKEREAIMQRIKEIPETETRVILATGAYIGEGFDDRRLDTLFLAMPISFKGKMEQYAGRILRPHPGKEEVRIYDYVDSRVSMLARMFKKRLKAYRAMKYEGEEIRNLKRYPLAKARSTQLQLKVAV
jgi:hypothetical protein